MENSINQSQLAFQEYLWKALNIFNIYRLLLTSALIIMQQTGVSPKLLGVVHPTLYLWTISLYFLFGILVILLLIKRFPGYKASVVLQISLDIFAVLAMIHSSGGLNNGLGVLLAVSVGVSCLLIGSHRALVVPAVATLGLFGEAFFATVHDLHVLELTAPAILGASFFIISILSLTLAKRLHYSEKLAIESQANLASMEAVSDSIIQTMDVGVILVDESNHVRLINDAALKTLGHSKANKASTLAEISEVLQHRLFKWKQNPSNPSSSKIKTDTGTDANEIQLRFRQLGDEEHNLILIFLEDTTKLNKRAQHLKLSSLGRLTASIAHEIRNPLGAISHAAQLLEESGNLTDEDKNLCDMINKHSKRMNGIIENVMNISQRKPPVQEVIALKPFLQNYISEVINQNHAQPSVELISSDEQTLILFDRTHFLQLLNNLCENGFRYSKIKTGEEKLKLTTGKDFTSGRQYLDIRDYGPGINEKDSLQLFEPFYTTSENGTGLGLYLCREICETNGARLSYRNVNEGTGCCFRVSFPVIEEQDLE